MTVVTSENIIRPDICKVLCDYYDEVEANTESRNFLTYDRLFKTHPQITSPYRDIIEAVCINPFRKETSKRGYFHYRLIFIKLVPGREGKTTKEHNDVGPIGTKSKINTMTYVFYLNEDFVGGELCFTQHDLLITPKTGKMVHWISSDDYRHLVKPLQSGARYNISVWWNK